MLKPGDKVRMNDNYYVSEENKNKIWVVRSEPWECCGTQIVSLQGKSVCDSCYNKLIHMLQAELDHLKRERDQAVEDMLQLAGGQCLFCKHDEDEIFNKCGTDNCWEWRGVQEENNE